MRAAWLLGIFFLIGIYGYWLMDRMGGFLEKSWKLLEGQGRSREGGTDFREEESTEERTPVGAALVLLDLLKSLAVLAAATMIGFLFKGLDFGDANIIMVYVLGVLITSMVTTQRVYSLASSIVSVVLFNFFFTYPKFSLDAYAAEYPVTFLIMFLAAFLTSSLALSLKNHARRSAQMAKEKEDAAVLARNEQLRANILRAISHDLRTPLTSISGNASNLLSNAKDFDEETKKRLYMDIYEDSMWLIRLVENLLAVTRIEDGKMDIRIAPELVDEVIEEALHHVSREGGGHRIIKEASDDLLLVKMDARLIMQVIINIVDNAIKYTPPGSEIRITAARDDGTVAVRISDNGPGMNDETKAHVFDTFYTGPKKIVDSHRSLGLGLSLCKSIVNAHGGEIAVSDNPPHGCIFTFTLPTGEVMLHE